MRKRILIFLMAALMIIGLLPVTALADDPTPLTADGGTLSGGDYILNSDITLSNDLIIDGIVSIDLNGHILTGTGSDSVITVNAGAALTLTDSVPYAEHTGEFEGILWGGVITGGTGKAEAGDPTRTHGGGLYVQGTVDMLGGSIAGNSAVNNGGGVYLDTGAVFNMGGEDGMSNISGNNAYQGAGVYAKGSTFNMSGFSEITENTGTAVGGVLVDGGSFTMSDLSCVSSNKATNFAGGVMVTNDAAFTMTGFSSVSGNSGQKGGGVYVVKGAFTMDGGSIKGNTASVNGGGVYVDTNGTITLGGAAKITDNAVGETVNNVYLPADKYIALGTKTETADGNGVDEPADDFRIGVTTQNAPADGAPVTIVECGATYWNTMCVISDAGYSVVQNEEKMQLESSYPVKVGGVQVTPANKDNVLGDGKVSYDPDTHTLKLTDAEIAADGMLCSSGINSMLADTLTIELNGNSRIGKVPADPEVKSNYRVLFGITSSSGGICMTGDGSLTVYSWVNGITAEDVELSSEFTGTLTIENYGEIVYLTENEYFSDNPAIDAAHNVAVRGGTLNVTCRDGGGIYAGDGNIVMEGGAAVHVTTDQFSGIKAAPGSLGGDDIIGSFYAGGGDVLIYNGAKVTVNAGRKATELLTDVYGIYAAGSIEIGFKDEIYDDPSEQPPTPAPEEVSVTVGNADMTGDFDVVGMLSENCNTSIFGSKVSVKNVKGRGIGIGASTGPESGCISINDSTVDVEAGASGIVAFQEGVDCDVNIANSTVTVKALDWGINALNDLTITDSTVTAQSDIWGMECDTLTVEGEKTQINATGGEVGLTVCGGANALTVKSGSLKLVGGEMGLDAGENDAFSMSLPAGLVLGGNRVENVFTNLQAVTLKKYSGADEFYEGHTVSYVGNERAKSVTLMRKSAPEEEEEDPPETGEANNMTPWSVLLTLSAMGLCACIGLSKKKKYTK